MDVLLDFLSFKDPNIRLVVFGMLLISISSSLVGSFAFLRRKSLVGDAVAHSLLPGIAMAFVLFESKNPWILIIGALISGWISILIMDYIPLKSKIKSDTAIALVLSVMFGLGILLITYIQHAGPGNQSGLDKFLFGKAASINSQDVLAFGSISILVSVVVLLFFKEFRLMAFNPEFAASIGLPVRLLSFIMNTLMVLAIIAGIQAVGVVLMVALLIAPPAAARSWTDSLARMIFLAVFISVISAIGGSFISYTRTNMPTGPWIVMALSVFTILSLFFAPRKGVLAKVFLQRKNQEKILTENILKAMYHLDEFNGAPYGTYSKVQIQQKRTFSVNELEKGLKILRRKLDIIRSADSYKLSGKGLERAKRVVRLHRLWELYLTQRMNMKSDHIHPNAETIEHIITPEIEKELIRELNQPLKDPHESRIPYDE